ncbi:type I-U CRISPR-associated RAMP protein Csb1/Cas7u [Candidatus Poriferisodalis sp.]|uniref:type I-G CRISPR-associated RAMP protein Csb1/Cas7g n=1 Tax=Candidatus Poriferisodalis sp. TaxID=3101277 RepID=UPI003B010EB2
MSKREMHAIELRAVPSDRFQPTGFPDLGAAKFEKPVGSSEWVDAILVESAQSMANRFEAVGWSEALQEPVSTLKGLPWIKVVAEDDGRYLTSSRTEAHRLASAFVKESMNAKGEDMVTSLGGLLELSDDTPLAANRIAAAIFALDPLCLIHGVFFADAKWPGQPKVARALTGFIEAVDVREAYSGGVKRDDVRHKIGEGDSGSTEGYGHVPYHRTEYTARSITLYVSIDIGQIEAYGLSPEATNLLLAVARWEVRSLLDSGLRLRTACEFEPRHDDQTIDLADSETLASEIRTLVGPGIPELRDLAEPPLIVRWSDGKKRSK